MRVLTVHNFYGSDAPSGENAAYLAERDLLRSNGVEVEEYTRHSDEIRGRGVAGLLRGGLSTAWNPAVARDLRRRVRAFRPDIVHVHNTFPLISPSIFCALRTESAAVIVTVHNFRMACASAMLSRNDAPCTLCVDRSSARPALRYRCYRGSFVATLPIAASITLHRYLGTWQKGIDAFIALTEFQAAMLLRIGVPAPLLHVKPNVYPLQTSPVDWYERFDRAVFIGRIGAEKGLDLLLEVWHAWGSTAPLLEVVGTGPLIAEARAYVDTHGMADRVLFHGVLPFHDTQRLLGTSRLLIVPSRVFEGYPMVVREAYALGVPVAASDIGSLRALVVDGVTGVRFPVGNPAILLERVRALWSRPELMRKMSLHAHLCYKRELAPEPNFDRVLAVYDSARRVRALRLNAQRWS